MESIVSIIDRFQEIVNSFVWGIPMLVLLVGTGIMMTVLTGFFQLTHIRHWMKCTIGGIFKDKRVTAHTGKHDKQISQFQSLCTALAATIGTGNIAGVASAIALGGPGAVFWMWVVSFFGMMTNFSENVLGIYYRRRNIYNEWSGGPMYYLRDGVGSRRGLKRIGAVLAVVFSVCCILASFGIGNMSQVNSISANMKDTFGVSPVVTGIILTVLAGLVIIGGIKRVASVTEKLVPFMALAYIIGTVAIFVMNFDRAGEVFGSIFRGAFGIRAAGGGLVGSGIIMAVQWGMKRGVFSNEAGLGSSVMVHSSSNVREPVVQGMWGIFEVFADTLVVCTLTAFALLSSGLVDLETGAILSDKVETALMAEAFSTKFGQAGAWFIAVAILCFAFSTLISWNHYGVKGFEYLFGSKAVVVYKIIFMIVIMIGATMKLKLAWDLSDMFNGMMALPNLVGVIVLSGTVVKITRNYIDRRLRVKTGIKPMLSAIEEIQEQHEKDIEEE